MIYRKVCRLVKAGLFCHFDSFSRTGIWHENYSKDEFSWANFTNWDCRFHVNAGNSEKIRRIFIFLRRFFLFIRYVLKFSPFVFLFSYVLKYIRIRILFWNQTLNISVWCLVLMHSLLCNYEYSVYSRIYFNKQKIS